MLIGGRQYTDSPLVPAGKIPSRGGRAYRKVARFAAMTDRIYCGTFDPFTNEATVCWWQYLDSIPTSDSITPISKRTAWTSTSTMRWLMAMVYISGNPVHIWAWPGNGISAASEAVRAEQWTHVAWVRGASTTDLYLNGTFMKRISGTQTTLGSKTDAALCIGNPIDATSEGLQGYLAEMAIYNAALTPHNIHDIIHGGVLSVPSNLRCYWPLENHCLDKTGNANGTPTDGVTFAVPPKWLPLLAA
jgi:hypothetical protein